jgi:hypothetical protein
MGRAPAIFTARRIPNDPRGEWCSGIEDGGLFYPSLHFRTRREAAKDSAAIDAVLQTTLRLADNPTEICS